MTVEYVLLLFCMFMIGLKFFYSAPMEAFRDYGPVLGARLEKHLSTGTGFRLDAKGTAHEWEKAK